MSDSCDLMVCSLPGSSFHGILQARILEWVVISFSRASSWPRTQIQVSCIAGRFFTIWAMREAQGSKSSVHINEHNQWHCLSLGLEWKLTFSRYVATVEFSKFADVLSAALSQNHLLGFEIAKLEFHHLH